MCSIFLVFFVSSLQQQIATNLTPYVTSAFAQHSLLSTTQVVSSIVGAVAKLPIAKIINIWGRAEGYILMVAICTIGLVMMAACNSVEMYAAAQVCNPATPAPTTHKRLLTSHRSSIGSDTTVWHMSCKFSWPIPRTSKIVAGFSRFPPAPIS